MVAARGEVDVATAPALRAAVDEALDRGPADVVVDLPGVTFIDSTGLGVLIGARRRCLDAGRRVPGGGGRAPHPEGVRDHRAGRPVHHRPVPRAGARVPEMAVDFSADARPTPPAPTTSPRPIRVELALSVEDDLLVLARFTVSAVASRAGFDVEEIEDLRLAVDELCLARAARAGAPGAWPSPSTPGPAASTSGAATRAPRRSDPDRTDEAAELSVRILDAAGRRARTGRRRRPGRGVPAQATRAPAGG